MAIRRAPSSCCSRAGRTELGTDAALWPAYLRGLAYLAQGAGDEARAEFQKILDHKGVLAPKDFKPVGMTLYPLAQLGLCPRRYADGRRWTRAGKAYEALLALWKDADAGVPVIRTATRDCRQLGVRIASR